ncbi:hypothetical protein [Streptomyces sp. NPDC002490]|uniref:hypothetical protein n=1 Tax=Streptomyces sp. NPDC002490 TaxID=3154416 RepID=UPI003330B150
MIKQLPRRGRRWNALGWVALTLGSGCLGIAHGSEGTSATTAWGLLALAAVLVVGGVWAVLRGRQHVAPVLTSLRDLPADEPIVLFLRAFKDDAGFSQVAALRWFRLLFSFMLPTPAHLRTEEQQVSRAVAPFGQLVALGDTKDKLPHLGAERHYASDGTWKGEVLHALDRATLVLLATGAGGGLTWEVEELKERDDPTRLVLLVSRGRGQYAQFQQALGRHFPRGLPSYPPRRLRHLLLRGRYVRAAIWFDSDWTPHWEMLDGRFPLVGLARRTQRALPRALRRVYRRAGVPARVKSTAPRPWAVKLSALLVAAFGLLPFAFNFGLALLVEVILKAIDEALSRSFGVDFSSEPSEPSEPSETDVIDIGFLEFLTAGWPLLLWLACTALWAYRVWCCGPYAIAIARVLGICLPAFLLASGMAVLPAGVNMVLLVVGLLTLLALAMPLAAVLLMRHDVREWIDSTL